MLQPRVCIGNITFQDSIDGALIGSFVFAHPTPHAGNRTVVQFAKEELNRAVVHWRRHSEENARVVADTAEIARNSQPRIWSFGVIHDHDPVLPGISHNLAIAWNDSQVPVGNR